MPPATTAGVYMLANEHADAIQRFAADPAVAAMLGIAQPPAPTAGTETVARLSAERLAGTSYWNAVVDQRAVKGFSALIGPYTSEPTLLVWIDPSSRRRGYGELAIRLALDFAFRNLQLPLIHAAIDATDAGQTAALTKVGFARADQASRGTADQRTLLHLTRTDWIAHRDRPAVARFHPALRTILDAELAAGNEIAETGGGWPDPDSVFIRLRDPFRTNPTPLPPGVVYTEPNGPHWWKADYSSQSPRHILAC